MHLRDFILGMAYLKISGINAKFTIKKQWTKFPFKTFMHKLGALGIDREKPDGIIDFSPGRISTSLLILATISIPEEFSVSYFGIIVSSESFLINIFVIN